MMHWNINIVRMDKINGMEGGQTLISSQANSHHGEGGRNAGSIKSFGNRVGGVVKLMEH